MLRERPRSRQWAGIVLYGFGVLAYLYPLSTLRGETIGFVVAGVGVLSKALSSILGRHVNRQGELTVGGDRG